MKDAKPKNSGFTLIELMIVVAVIAVLAAIAYPSYTRYVYRARRSDGQDLLMRIAAAEERFYSNYNTYTPNIAGPVTATPPGLGLNTTSSQNYYAVGTLAGDVAATATTFLITVRPQGAQAGDTSCTSLGIDQALSKTWTPVGTPANGSCW